jgi:hypothetical protein
MCAAAIGYRTHTAVAEWVKHVPAPTAPALDVAVGLAIVRAMIRRLLRAMDPALLTAVIDVWLAGRP